MSPTRRARALTLLTATGLALAPCAQASFPGANGPIAYVTQVHGVLVIKSAFLGPEDILQNETLLSPIGGGGANAFDPAWSQSGRYLAFTSDRSGHDQIYSAEPACGTGSSCQTRRLLSDAVNDREASWAPSARGGESLVFTSDRSGTPQIYKLTMTRGLPKSVVRLTFDQAEDSEARWSSTGKIAFVSNRGGSPQIYVMNGSGGEVRQITQTGLANLAPAWSPSGEKLSYTSDTEKEGSQIFTVNAGGGEPRRVTAAQPQALSSVWSPDGKLILVNFRPDSAGESSMRVIDTAGTPISPLYLGARMESDWAALPAPRRKPTAGLTVIVQPTSGHTTINPVPATGKATQETTLSPGEEEAAPITTELLASKLTKPVEAPVNSTYDATHGEIRLSVASSRPGGSEPGRSTAGGPAPQPATAFVRGGRFELLQHGAKAAPTIHLLGRAHGCGHRRASSARRQGGQPNIHVKSKGRMQGEGKSGKLATKGTAWGIKETCRGTLYSVFEHSALVTDPGRKRTVVVKAGHSYLVRPGR